MIERNIGNEDGFIKKIHYLILITEKLFSEKEMSEIEERVKNIKEKYGDDLIEIRNTSVTPSH